MLVVAHLSDIHLDGTERASERATRVMSYVNSLPGRLDAILVTGDIADHGRDGEYAQAREILKARSPVLLCPGNHDVRAAYRRTLLATPPSDEPINAVHHVGGAVFLMCDSSIPGRDDGFLDDPTIAWLEARLVELAGATQVFVCFHHPPVRLHVPFIDEIRLGGERRLADLLDRHPEVVAVLCGHAHTAAATTFAGRPLVVAPGVVSTVRLPWEGGAGDSVLDYSAPPAVAFHILDDGGRLTTHYRVVL